MMAAGRVLLIVAVCAVAACFSPFFAGAEESSEAPVLVPVQGDRFILDLRYDSENNFLHKNVYAEFGLNGCFVRPALKERLDRASGLLAEKKLKLVFFDCFRPLSVQREMWRLVPDTRYVANPDRGSHHNRGVAIDVTLVGEDGQYLPMPTEFDDFSAKAASSYVCPEAEKHACENRDLLREILIAVGLTGLRTEWWHFQLPDAGKYSLIESYDAGSTK